MGWLWYDPELHSEVLMEGCTERVLDVSFEDGVFGTTRRVAGFHICLCTPISLVATDLVALETMIELVDITEDTFKKYSLRKSVLISALQQKSMHLTMTPYQRSSALSV
jgi:hypothetical protein